MELLGTPSTMCEACSAFVKSTLPAWEQRLNFYLADRFLSPEEEADLRSYQLQLGLTDHDVASAMPRLLRAKQLSAINMGDLPQVHPGNALLSRGEVCHYTSASALYQEIHTSRYVSNTTSRGVRGSFYNTVVSERARTPVRGQAGAGLLHRSRWRARSGDPLGGATEVDRRQRRVERQVERDRDSGRVIDPKKAGTRIVAPGIRLHGTRARLEGPATAKEAGACGDSEMTMAATVRKKPAVRIGGADVRTTSSIDRAAGLTYVWRTSLKSFFTVGVSGATEYTRKIVRRVDVARVDPTVPSCSSLTTGPSLATSASQPSRNLCASSSAGALQVGVAESMEVTTGSALS